MAKLGIRSIISDSFRLQPAKSFRYQRTTVNGPLVWHCAFVRGPA